MRTVLRLCREAAHWWPDLLAATVALLGITGLSLWTPLLIKEILRLLRTAGPTAAATQAQIGRLCLVLLAAYLVRAAAQYVVRYRSHVAGHLLIEHMRNQTYDHLQKLSLRFFEDRQVGQLLSRVISDVDKFEALVSHAVPDACANLLLFFGVAVVLFRLDARLAAYTLLPMPLLLWLAVRFGSSIRPALRRAQARMGDLSGLISENLSGIREIQVFTQEGKESARVHASVRGYIREVLDALRRSATYHPGIEFAGSLGTVAVLWFGARQVLFGGLPPETVVAFVLYLSMFYGPVTATSAIVESIQTSLAGAERVFELLDTEPDIHDTPGARPLPRIAGELRFEDVTFAYRPGEPVLEHLSFTVRPGETLALVGPTGVGKTTIASLVPRFYDPTGGRVLLDGHDLRTVTLASLRSQISLVLQDVFLFNGTVAENIRYGAPGATMQQVEEAARKAHAHDFITQLPEGYETVIGERGVKLSGGQKQRLAIARALLRDAPLLILDEATSAVDSETEAQIQAALKDLVKGRTTIIIAHRLSTVREADQILVLEGGGIAEAGRHGDLLAQDGLYARLYQTQFRSA
ncbi:MAG: ABC transporter ATP-binding protein [Chitinophagales bacterium]